MTEDSIPPPDTPSVAPSEPDTTQSSLRTPSNYYSQPASTDSAPKPDRKGCGKWALGCGGAGCLVGVASIAFFVWLAGPGLGKATAFVLQQVKNEAHKQALGDLPVEVRDEFSEEIEKLGDSLREGTLSQQEVQSLLFELQATISDQEITADEIESLLETMKELNGDSGGEVSF